MNRPWRIGITGGIGSGKTTVCRIFSVLGYRVYSADDAAKRLMATHPPLIEAIRRLLGPMAYTEDGRLNRAWIASQVFGNEGLLKALNQQVHPAVGQDWDRWATKVPEGYELPFVLKEAAILFESGAHEGLDAVITVYAPKSVRIQRVVRRDGVEPDQVRVRMDKQWPEDRKLALAERAIFNDGIHPIIPQVLAAAQYFGDLRRNA